MRAAGRRGLFGRFDQLDILPQERVDEFAERHPPRCRPRAQEGQDIGVEMNGRHQDGILAVEPAALGVGKIVFVLHGFGSSRYCLASLAVGLRAEMIRASAPNPKFAHTVPRVRLRTSGSKGALESYAC